MTEDKKDLNDWMKGIKVTASGLPDSKGIVVAIYEPQGVKTRFGDKKAMQVVINGKDGSTVHSKLFVPEKFPAINPKSGLAKLLKHYGCNELIELIGKEVEVEQIGDFLWKIKDE